MRVLRAAGARCKYSEPSCIKLYAGTVRVVYKESAKSMHVCGTAFSKPDGPKLATGVSVYSALIGLCAIQRNGPGSCHLRLAAQ